MKYTIILLALWPLPGLADAVVATRTLRAGDVIQPSDVRLATDQNGTLNDPAQAIGLETRVMVSEGRPLRPEHLSSPTLVARNQAVTIIYDKGPLRIEAEGRALTAGSAGQSVRVMNSSSRVTVTGRVSSDGTISVAQN